MNFSVQVARSITSSDKLLGIQQELEALKSHRRFVDRNSEEDMEFADRIRQLQGMLKPAEDHVSFQQYRRVRDKEPHFDDPLFLFYKPDRSFTKLTRRSNLAVAERLPKPTLAHRNALRGERINLNDFLVWFGLSETGALGDGYRADNLRDALAEVIKNILPEVGEVRVIHPDARALPFFLISKYQEGKLLGSFKIEQLSDGERMLLGLAFDLTRRLTLANPKLKDPVSDGCAIVLIDEIELHLHPTWQRRILRRLRKAFPNCQFIVTTHSPQVIGQTRAENLRCLYVNEAGKLAYAIPGQAKGMDSSWILQHIMGCPARDIQIEQKLGEVFEFIEENKLCEARALALAIETDVGMFPELQEASSLLDRLELLSSDEEDS